MMVLLAVPVVVAAGVSGNAGGAGNEGSYSPVEGYPGRWCWQSSPGNYGGGSGGGAGAVGGAGGGGSTAPLGYGGRSTK